MIITKEITGQRHTDQRRLVLGALKTILGTPTAEEVWKRVRGVRRTVGLATVYRNLKKLSGRGEILELPGGAQQRYAGFAVERGVFRCQRCGEETVTDRVAMPTAAVVPHGAKALGFELTVTGICGRCRQEISA